MFYCDPGPTFIGNEISYNWALVYGGGIYFQYGGGGIIDRCLLYGNTGEVGGGIAVDASRNAEIYNCTIADNIASVWGGGIYTATFSYPILMNTIVYGNEAADHINLFTSADDSFDISYSDIEDGWYGSGNIDADPLFTNPGLQDYSLSWLNYPVQDSTKSPCIDTGNPVSPFDPDCTISDIGYIHFDQALAIIEDLSISLTDSTIVLCWSSVPGAVQYRVYSACIPYFTPLGEPLLTIEAPDTMVFLPETGLNQMNYIVTSFK